MDLQGIAKIGEKTADVADNKISVADEVKTEVGKAATLNPSILNTPVKPSVVASSASSKFLNFETIFHPSILFNLC